MTTEELAKIRERWKNYPFASIHEVLDEVERLREVVLGSDIGRVLLLARERAGQTLDLAVVERVQVAVKRARERAKEHEEAMK